MKKQFLFFFLGVILVAVATVSYSFTVTSDSSEAVELIDEAEPPCCPNGGPWREAKASGEDLPYDPLGYERFDQNGDGIICYFAINPIRFMDNIGPSNSFPPKSTSGGD